LGFFRFGLGELFFFGRLGSAFVVLFGVVGGFASSRFFVALFLRICPSSDKLFLGVVVSWSGLALEVLWGMCPVVLGLLIGLFCVFRRGREGGCPWVYCNFAG